MEGFWKGGDKLSNRSKIALVVCVAIWISCILFSVCAFRQTGGYSIYSLILLPFSLLVYLGNYYGCDDDNCAKKTQSTVKCENDCSDQAKNEKMKIGEEKEKNNKETWNN